MTLDGLTQRTPLTLRTIFDRMRDVYADGEVVSPEGRFTYGSLADRVLRLATVLRDDLGVQPGDRVATFAHNSARHFLLYHAVPLIGGVLHTVNVRLFGDQVAAIVQHAEDGVMFADPETAPLLDEIRPKLDCVRELVTMDEGFDDRIDRAKPVADRTLPDIDEHAAFGLCYTSGTTGMPKGVLGSHRGMYLHSVAVAMAGGLGLNESDRVYPVVPLFHAFGWGLAYAAPFVGAELVFGGTDATAPAVGRLIQDERVTVAAAVPTIWKELLPRLKAKLIDASSLRGIFVGGSALPGTLIDEYARLGIDIVQIWGMTETGPIACISRPRRRHRGLGSNEMIGELEKTGTIFPMLEARIVAADGTVCPRDGSTVGELEVRGPWIASGYYKDDSPEKFRDGWLRTGDMAWMEADGTFRIVDRAKDLVKSGGEWISSVELEGELLAHPKIKDAAVVGVRSRKWDERPVAVIVPDGEVPSLEEVREFLAPHFAKWWLPDEIVVMEEIPKTSVGKLDKKAIRSLLAEMELP